ncbi:MAG: CoA transferase [Deltaproteobacteria bacterium]|nr:CoA transferase [Deltaproteobacteria bacterium]
MSRLPLAGIRVTDFTWAWAGPYCTLQMAHMGAEVIRIESQKRPCVSRLIPSFADDVPGPNRAGYFNQYSQGKKSLQLDLGRPEGIEIAKQLIAKSDIVVQNFSAGAIDRMGLGYETLKQIKPDLIMVSICGYGQTGPERQYMGYGPASVPLSGISSLTGYRDVGPAEVGISYGDPNAGIFGSFAAMAALAYRQRTGKGVHIDLALWEALLVLMPEGLMDYAMNRSQPERDGNRDRWMAPHGCFKCQGDADKWVTIACGSETEWQALCQAMGNPELATDKRFANVTARKANEDILETLISEWTQARDRWEVTELLQKAGVSAFPSMSNKDLATNPHLQARGYLVQKEHPEVGTRIHAGIPWQMSGTPCEVRAAAPLRGQQTDEVLRNILGLSEDAVRKLHEGKVLL